MTTATFDTHRITGLDYRIWLVMGTASLLSAGLLFFQKVQHQRFVAAPCPVLPLSVDGKQKPTVICPPNRTVIFSLGAPKGARVTWEFDDGTAAVSGAVTQHKFLKEGQYTVEASVDGSCTQSVDVLIKEALNSEVVKPELQIFSDSAEAMVGSRLRFSAASFPAAKTYQWLVQETGEKAEGENAGFRFLHPGIFTLRLTADNNPAWQQIRQITIKDFPVAPLGPLETMPPGGGPLPNVGDLLPPVPGGNGGSSQKGQMAATNKSADQPAGGGETPKPKSTAIDPDAFKGFFQQVLNGDNPVNSLDAYLPYRETTQVFEEGNNNSVSLKEFCAKNKNRTIDALRFNRDDQKSSIQSIVVKLKSKGFFGKIFGKKNR